MTRLGFRLIVAIAAGGLAFLLAAHHPVWPALALSAVFCWAVMCACFPTWWLFVVPACLPWLNFAPWSGWRVVEEFDLLLLATLAGVYGRWAWTAVSQVSADGRLTLKTKTADRLSRGDLEPRKDFPHSPGLPILFQLLLAAVVVTTCVSAWRGWVGAPGPGNANFAAWLFQDEHSALSSLRLGKSLWFAVFLLPLWMRQMRLDGGSWRVHRVFALGMCAGLAVVACMALWERAAFPGWLNFSTHYRTTATFWEMHFGGAAIDIYLVASAPFAVWFLLGQRRPLRWLAAASLTLLAMYAVLTTFSRGVYGAALLPLLLLGIGKLMLRHRQWWAAMAQSLGQVKWRGRAGVVLALLLLGELVTVVWGGNYMRERLADSEADLGQRVQHWQRGLALLQTPADQLWGIGLGRLPARYAAQGDAQDVDTGDVIPTEFSGRAQVLTEPQAAETPPKAFLRLSGPATQAQLGGLFSVNQRLGGIQIQRPVGLVRPDSGPEARRGPSAARGQPPGFGGVYVVVKVRQVRQGAMGQTQRSAGAAILLIKLCEKHLIYEGNCHVQAVKVQPPPQASALQPALGTWQTLRVALRPYQNLPTQGVLQRSSSLSFSVMGVGQAIDMTAVQLWTPVGQLPLQNANFTDGMANWLPGAGGYYLPWHIDNLYLELLIERGGLGLAAVLALWAWAMRCLWVSWQRQNRQTAAGQPALAPAKHPPGLWQNALVPYLAASVLGCTLAGTVSSVLDAPRIGFLFFSLLLLGVLADYGRKNHSAEGVH